MAAKHITIGALGKAAGVHIETIRYYEKIGLLPQPARTASGYRTYGPGHVRRLAFIRKARDLGFHIDTIRTLLRLGDHPEMPCGDADRLAAEHLDEVERRIADLVRLRDELRAMASCEGHTVRECRIIEALTDGRTDMSPFASPD